MESKYDSLAGWIRPKASGAVSRPCRGILMNCDRDTNEYPTGIRISKSEMAALDIRRAEFHGDWNYTLPPTPDRAAVIS